MASATVGTLAWTRRTGGKLNKADRGRLAALGVELQLRALGARVAAGLGLRRERLDRIRVEDLRAPDTPAAREAERACDALPPHLAAHSYRTWLWAALLGVHDRIAYDAELLFVACMLHDTGLTLNPQGAEDRCFTLASAETAKGHADRGGFGAARGERLGDAITLHMNPYVGRRHGLEAHLLSAGAALDVVGTRRWQIADQLAAEVLALHPRLEFKRLFDRRLREHAAVAPACRTAFLYRFGRFDRLIRDAPFSE